MHYVIRGKYTMRELAEMLAKEVLFEQVYGRRVEPVEPVDLSWNIWRGK